MKNLIFLTVFLAGCSAATQDMSHSLPGKRYYREMKNPVQAPPGEWEQQVNDVSVSFASDNVRYGQRSV